MGHEDFQREAHIEGSSNRSFGLVMAAAFLVISLIPLVRGAPMRLWALAPSALFATIALARPAILAPLNRWWSALGVLLGKFVSPIALGVLFYLVLTPMALMMKLLGKDVLALKRDSRVSTYWISRQPPGPPPDSMGHQF